MERVAEWYFQGSIEKANKFLDNTSGKMKDLFNLDSRPNLELESEVQDVVRAEQSVLEGEKVTQWCLEDLDTGHRTPLPAWFKSPLDKA